MNLFYNGSTGSKTFWRSKFEVGYDLFKQETEIKNPDDEYKKEMQAYMKKVGKSVVSMFNTKERVDYMNVNQSELKPMNVITACVLLGF